MNVRCPECKTLFRLADDKVGAHGAKVRCGKCRHVFIATRAEGGAPAGTEPAPSAGGAFGAPSPLGAPPPQSTVALSADEFGNAFPPPPPLPPLIAGRPLGNPNATAAAVPSAMQQGADAAPGDALLSPFGGSADPFAPPPPPALPSPEEEDERIDAATAMGRRRAGDDEAIDAATAMGRGAQRLEGYERERRRQQERARVEEAPPEADDFLRFDDAPAPGADDNAPPFAEPEPRQEPRLPVFGPPQSELPSFEDRTTVDRPAWLVAHIEGMGSASAANRGAQWAPPAEVPLPPKEEPAAAPEPPAEASAPAGPSSLDPEALFGGADAPPAQAPVSLGPAVIAAQPTSPAAARLAAQREGIGGSKREGQETLRPRRTVERPFASPPGRRAILRAGGFVLALAGLLAIFVLWRNDWRFEPIGMMMARAFGGAGAPRVRSLIPSVTVRRVRRDVFESANGNMVLAVSGELENDGTDVLQKVQVMVRLLDREGNPVAEREQHAVGLFEPAVLSRFTDAVAVDVEYKKRQPRSVLRPGSRLDFMILFFPFPREAEGMRVRMVVEVTGAVPTRS